MVAIPLRETDRKIRQQAYKARLVLVGKAIRDSYFARRSEARFSKEVLGGLARNQLDELWFWTQLQQLAEEAEPEGRFDAQQNWRALGADDNLEELLYLLRLLWTAAGRLDEGHTQA